MIRYKSTRNPSVLFKLENVIEMGLATDGGLFVPNEFPKVEVRSSSSLQEISVKALAPFFKDSLLENDLEEIVSEAFNFDLPIRKLSDSISILELFHGPTLAFKDFGARFLAACLDRIAKIKQGKMTIIAATSGDTGSAVAAAFHKKKYVDLAILFPEKGISSRQFKQLSSWDDNILSLALNGTFDDCQKLVKEAFENKWWQENTTLTTANSINIARVFAQYAYWAYCSVQVFNASGKKANFIIPSGNLGNATAAYWARKAGFPIDQIVMSSNANHCLKDYLLTGIQSKKDTIKTLANAMDVGNPSNLERLISLYPEIESFRNNITNSCVSDPQIKTEIKKVYDIHNYLICPHTATAFSILNNLDRSKSWQIAATAHPVKFEKVVEKITSTKIDIPSSLQKILKQKSLYKKIKVSQKELINTFKEFKN